MEDLRLPVPWGPCSQVGMHVFRNSKVKIEDVYAKSIPFNDILTKLKLNDGAPVVNLIGARDTNRGKFYGGIARACFNTV